MPAKKKPSTPAGLVLRQIKRYGWVPDMPDQRDLIYEAPRALLRKLPPKIDLRPKCPAIYDQLSLGSCTANAIGAALECNQLKQGWPEPFTPSRLFIYYNERVIEHTVNTDAGAMNRDGIKCVAKLGAPPEDPFWPYAIARFRRKPPPKAYKEAKKHPALLYERLPRNEQQLRGCLASGFPFVLGIAVYDSFESPQVAKTGTVPMPKAIEKNLGGHAILAVGYDDKKKRFIARNSWGPNWGMKGYFTLPYAYVMNENLADDFWTIKMVQ